MYTYTGTTKMYLTFFKLYTLYIYIYINMDIIDIDQAKKKFLKTIY